MRFFCGLLLLASVLAACGGSSSETPPPLQPDPAMRRYTGPRVAQADELQPEQASAAEGSEAAASEEAAASPSGAPAPATWGSSKPRKPAPDPQ